MNSEAKRFEPQVGKRYLFRSHDGLLFEITVLEVAEHGMKVKYSGESERWVDRPMFLLSPSTYWRENTLVEELPTKE